jgi:hypothetical protein
MKILARGMLLLGDLRRKDRKSRWFRTVGIQESEGFAAARSEELAPYDIGVAVLGGFPSQGSHRTTEVALVYLA